MEHTLIIPDRKELKYGWRYLLFQAVFLGSFITLAAQLLGFTLRPIELNLIYFCINFIVVVLLCRRFLGRSLGFGLRHIGKSLSTAFVGFGIYQFLSIMLSTLILQLEPGFANINDQNLAAIGQENYPLLVIGTVLLVPLTEEVFYRGIVFGSIYRRNRIAAYIICVVLFSLVHISGYFGTTEPRTLLLCFLQYIPAGICLAAAYEYSGSLLPSILIHTAVNAIGVMAMR